MLVMVRWKDTRANWNCSQWANLDQFEQQIKVVIRFYPKVCNTYFWIHTDINKWIILLPCKKVPKNLYRYSKFKEVEHNSHSLLWPVHSDILSNSTVWNRGKKRKFTIGNLGKRYLSLMIKVDINSKYAIIIAYTFYVIWRNDSLSPWCLPHNP